MTHLFGFVAGTFAVYLGLAPMPREYPYPSTLTDTFFLVFGIVLIHYNLP